MNNRDDGGPAFPGEQGHTPNGTWNPTWSPGMDLRDWFAGRAMQGIYASSFNDERCPPCDKIAEWAYSMADAMLLARKGE